MKKSSMLFQGWCWWDINQKKEELEEKQRSHEMVEIKEGENNSSVKQTNREKKKKKKNNKKKKSASELHVQDQLVSLKLMQPHH